FRRSVKDVMKPEHNDHFLLRWLRVIFVPFVGLDAWGLLHSISRTDVIRMLTVVFDLEGFNIRQYAWKPAAEMVFSLLQLYEANYPEILKICYIVNVVKKFMHEYTISKIKIYGSDSKKWQAQLLGIIDADQLPVHYGGTMLDENGDPRCSLIVKPGGKVPKQYYSKNANDTEKEYKRVTIKTGEKHTVDLLCADADSVLNHDIKFVIKRRDEEGNVEVVHGPRKIHEGAVDVGVLSVSGPATYSVIFDNKSAFLRSKKVFYDVLISVPTRDLSIISVPDENTAPAATSAQANMAIKA
ncbi:CRAL/TRIO domain-containing protein, partial [Operophtera brumata]